MGFNSGFKGLIDIAVCYFQISCVSLVQFLTVASHSYVSIDIVYYIPIFYVYYLLVRFLKKWQLAVALLISQRLARYLLFCSPPHHPPSAFRAHTCAYVARVKVNVSRRFCCDVTQYP